MTRILRGALLAVVLLVAGCVRVPLPFTDEFYAPIRVRAGAAPAEPVTVRPFADERAVADATLVFEYRVGDRAPRVERATMPVGEGVARAFRRGLRARGFRVTDDTAGAERPPAARAVVTGGVTEFGVTMARGSLVTGSRQRVGCRVALEVRDAAGSRRVWAREYGRVVEGSMLVQEPLTILAQALADVVEQAAADPDLAAAVAAAAR